MYTLETSIETVHGVGQTTKALLAKQNIATVKELLLAVPLRYEDRSNLCSIAEAKTQQELVTIQATLLECSSFYKNKRLVVRAKVADDSGELSLIWFNNRFVQATLKKGKVYFFSGKISQQGSMVQAAFETVSSNTLHTNRLVPAYTTTLGLKQGTLRRILKHICDNLALEDDPIPPLVAQNQHSLPTITQALKELHFPHETQAVTTARERLALEELLILIRHSQATKERWKLQGKSQAVATSKQEQKAYLDSLPFELTASQKKVLTEILADLNSVEPMNRLLVGDVGSGKTVIAGIALHRCVANNTHGCLVAPTQILAEQHAQTLRQFFPKTKILLVTSRGVETWLEGSWTALKNTHSSLNTPSILIGTHALLNLMLKTPFPLPVGLVVYDEQHRFGVTQRSSVQLAHSPHTLTMTATPIPRSLMLTIFAHLNLSVITELPKERVPTKTWLVTERKKPAALEWLVNQINQTKTQDNTSDFLVLVVCPFIEQSKQESLSTIAAATVRYEEIKAAVPTTTVALLHGKQTATKKQAVLKKLYARKIDILVTTPIVEVGVDLPQASAIVIEAAERFGLASLHQLRGRVGRAGQQGYCLLFPSIKSGATAHKRLKLLETIRDGTTLAEEDLKHRGAGDLFGTSQHGFDYLQFANWSNTTLIGLAQVVAKKLPQNWQSPLFKQLEDKKIPVAN